jgi:hypothetical protein
MTAKRLHESAKLSEGKTRSGVWPIRLITEGKGSSGIYSRELLESHREVFANRPMFGNHPADPNQPWTRSPFDIKAKLGPAIEFKVVDGVAGLYGEAHVSPEVDAWLEEFHDVVGVSIFASGNGRENDEGEYVVESFDGDDPYTSVDFVVAPGRGGGVERVMEAYRALEENGTAPAGTGRNEGEYRMDEATKAFIEGLFKGVDDKFTALEEKLDNATALVESVKNAQPERVEAVDAAAELATAVAEAKLGEKAVKRVLESVKSGSPVADAVKHETELRDEVLAEAKVRVQEGVFGGADDNNHDWRVAGIREGL